MQVLNVVAVGSDFAYRWPSGNVETYPQWVEYSARGTDGRSHNIRIGYCLREVYGADRPRVTVWVDDHPSAEFFGVDDFDHSGEVVSEIRVAGDVGEVMCRYPEEPIPERYVMFNTVGLPTRVEARGVRNAWAVVANVCDHKTMIALAALRNLERVRLGYG